MKPVREAAIEAINLIKDLDPSYVTEDTISQDSSTKRDRISRSNTEKPWKRKDKKPVRMDDDATTSVIYSNRDQDEDTSEKKISAATKKRLEALEAKKNALPTK